MDVCCPDLCVGMFERVNGVSNLCLYLSVRQPTDLGLSYRPSKKTQLWRVSSASWLCLLSSVKNLLFVRRDLCAPACAAPLRGAWLSIRSSFSEVRCKLHWRCSSCVCYKSYLTCLWCTKVTFWPIPVLVCVGSGSTTFGIFLVNWSKHFVLPTGWAGGWILLQVLENKELDKVGYDSGDVVQSVQHAQQWWEQERDGKLAKTIGCFMLWFFASFLVGF